MNFILKSIQVLFAVPIAFLAIAFSIFLRFLVNSITGVLVAIPISLIIYFALPLTGYEYTKTLTETYAIVALAASITLFLLSFLPQKS